MTVVDLETRDGPDVSVFTYALDPAWSVGDPSHDSSAPPEGGDDTTAAGQVTPNMGDFGRPAQDAAGVTTEERQEVTEEPLISIVTVRPLGSARPGPGDRSTPEPDVVAKTTTQSLESIEDELVDVVQATEPPSSSPPPPRPSGPIHFPGQSPRPPPPPPPPTQERPTTRRPLRPIFFPGVTQKTTTRPPLLFGDDVDDETLIKQLLDSVNSTENFPVSRRKGMYPPASVKLSETPVKLNETPAILTLGPFKFY